MASRGRTSLATLLTGLLAACGPQPERGWVQHDLADPGLPLASAEQLETCQQRLVAAGFLGPEQARPADASNFGLRRARDELGRPVPHTPLLIVLHETVLDLPSTIALFQRNEPSDAAQASYHVLIGRNGERVRIVPDREDRKSTRLNSSHRT